MLDFWGKTTEKTCIVFSNGTPINNYELGTFEFKYTVPTFKFLH